MQRTTNQQPEILSRVVLPGVTGALAVAAGAIHLAHNYLPMQAPGSSSAAPPAAGEVMNAGGPSGLMSLIMPHLSQVMVLNFAGFVGLAVLLLAIARLRAQLRVTVDVLLAGLSVVTLYVWNAMGRANPAGMGTMALVVELAVIAITLGDAMLLARTRVPSRLLAARSA